MTITVNNTLLCIDDDSDILAYIHSILDDMGCRMLTASDYKQALAMLDENEIGLVLCDYHLPEKNGIEILGEIKLKSPNTISILMTADSDSSVVIEAINSKSIFKFIGKPLTREILINEVNEGFRIFNLASENEKLARELSQTNKELLVANKKLKDHIEEKTEQIARLTFYDELTDLPNKAYLMEWLSHSLSTAERNEQGTGILMVGIDRFKKVNQSLGHSKGDQLLIKLVSKIASLTRKADVICRISGDMFCVVSHGTGKDDDFAELSTRLLNGISRPITLDKKHIYLSASIGISVFPTDGETADDLLRNAETALHHAKEKGGDNYQYFTSEFNVRAKKRLSLEAELHNAIKNEEFVLHFQPRVCSEKMKVIGAEVLLRWQHPSRGLVSPLEFIPLLEETGLILPVGEWVINEVCRTLKRWQEIGMGNIKISANLSPCQFRKNHIVNHIKNIAADPEYSPLLHLLELEITESVLMEDIDRAKSLLDNMHDKGITLAIDDFGTGYSALNYLIKLPFDDIKIDISFIKQMGASRDADTVIRSIVMLAQSLRIKSVAEGVENLMQAQSLRVLGCDEYQGYLFGKPCIEEQFLKSIKPIENKNWFSMYEDNQIDTTDIIDIATRKIG